uniref:non-specific serine/threonine protein kinase n=1 Tax=Aureoumbra lagunensis TaxID=44058 RepID=A0A7S3NKU2_9STRA
MYGLATVAKERFCKDYRAAALDCRLRKERTVQEARCIARCRQNGVSTPAIYMVDTARYVIYMERIPGLTAKAYIEKFRKDVDAVTLLMRRIATAIAKIHDAGFTHGDLTTSNFICRRREDDARDASYFEELVVIDFGLGGTRSQLEDKAVDLYVLERALISTHRDSQHLLSIALQEYERSSANAKSVLHRLEAVRARGRKRECFG